MEILVVVVAFAVPILVLGTAIALRLATAGQRDSSWTGQRKYNLFAATYVFIAIGFFTLVLMAIINGWLAGISFLLFAIVLAQMVSIETSISGKRRLAQQAELLWLMATTIRNQGNLADELETYANCAWGSRRKHLLELAERIRDGIPLSEIAVPQGLLSQSAALEVQAGLTSGRLYEALRCAALRESNQMISESIASKAHLAMIYPAAVCTAMALIVGFVMYYIIPKFKKIFDDFGTELPGMTILLINISDTLVNYWYLGAPLVYVFIATVIAAERAEYHGWQAMCKWLFGRWSVRIYTPDVLRYLSHAVAAKQDLHVALSGIFSSGRSGLLKSRIWNVRAAVMQGANCWQVLRKERFLTSNEVALLETAQDVGNLPWTLVAVADAIERRWSYRLSAVADLFGPAAIVTLGMAVGFVAIGLFIPLVKLLNDLS